MPQARMECSQQAETRSRRKTRTAMEKRVLKQRLNHVQSRVGATATRAHVESPPCTELFVDSCSVRHQGNCCANTRGIPATWISIRTQSTDRCSCDNAAALARHEHTWICLRAQKDMFRRKDCCILTTVESLSVRKQTCSCDNTAAFAPREHTWISVRKKTFSGEEAAAFSRHNTLGSLSVRKQEDMFMRHAAAFARHNTLGSVSVRKETFSDEKAAAFSRREHTWISLLAKNTCSCDNTAAFARCEYTWIPLHPQRSMFRQNDCCVLKPRAHLDLSLCASKKTSSCDTLLRSHATTHLDLSLCAKRHVAAKRLLRSHAASTLGSRSVRKETCCGKTLAAISRCPPR